MVFATVPDAPPAWKNTRATSWPAPISANVPYFRSSRLIVSALRLVVSSSFFSLMVVDYGLPREWCNLFVPSSTAELVNLLLHTARQPGNNANGLRCVGGSHLRF